MGKHSQKRKHSQFAEEIGLGNEPSTLTGIASTLDYVRRIRIKDGPHDTHDEVNHAQVEEEQTAPGGSNRKNEKQQKKPTYPALSYAGLHRLQSSLKIIDLQNLILYCLADGVSPQWIGINSRSAIRKAVVLFVPGLEKGMFDGSIPLEEPSKTAKDPEDSGQDDKIVNGKNKEKLADGVVSRSANQKKAESKHTVPSPDDYLPVRLTPGGDSLPDLLKPFADMFRHLWPVRAPGDGRFAKVHSPLHAMLTVPLTKNQEGKFEGKKRRGGKSWENKRTAITAVIASKEELRENEYTLHPAMFVEQYEQEQEELRRQAANETSEAGWVDSLVDKIENGEVPDEDIEQGSLTAGRSVLAMDCEMCKVDGGEMALSRVSIVRWDGEVIMDELVKPDKPIVDYLTAYAFLQTCEMSHFSWAN